MTPLIRDWVKVYAESGGDPADGLWFDISGALHRADVPALELTLEHARPPIPTNAQLGTSASGVQCHNKKYSGGS